jgi:hypothetical protein
MLAQGRKLLGGQDRSLEVCGQDGADHRRSAALDLSILFGF